MISKLIFIIWSFKVGPFLDTV